MFDKKFLEKQEKKLKEKRKKIKEYLKNFSVANWESEKFYPDEEADEVEEFLKDLPLEERMKQKYKEIERALRKIKKGTYGICEKCKKAISKKRLNLLPEARFCKNCAKKYGTK